MAKGWAVKSLLEDKILIETVSATRRAAIVNWLWVFTQFKPLDNWTDQMIEDCWLKTNDDVELIEVSVFPKASQ